MNDWIGDIFKEMKRGWWISTRIFFFAAGSVCWKWCTNKSSMITRSMFQGCMFNKPISLSSCHTPICHYLFHGGGRRHVGLHEPWFSNSGCLLYVGDYTKLPSYVEGVHIISAMIRILSWTWTGKPISMTHWVHGLVDLVTWMVYF